LKRDRDARGLLNVRVFAAEKVGLNATVFDAVENGASRGVAVAASASCFLIVGLDAPGKVIVDDETDIALVDPESERICRDYGLELSGHESVLHVLAVGRRHLSVVEPYGHVAAQLLVQ